jgi:hypothetical protein
LNQPGCAPPQSVQRAADLTREVRKLALQLAATVTYGPLVTTMDNALFPDGLTADEASRLNKRFPGADHVLRLAASASPFAGFASNIPRADRERIATGVRNLALGFAARYYEHVGASDDANGIRYMMRQPYVPDGSIARIVRTTWEDANRK